MAHEITRVDKVLVRHDSGHGGAWHGLDKAVYGEKTPAEFWEEAGLTYSVIRYPMLIQGLKPIRGVPKLGTPFVVMEDGTKYEVQLTDESFALLVHNPDGRSNVPHRTHLSTVGKDYNVVQLDLMKELMEKFCTETGATMETAGSVRGGKVVFASCNLGDNFVLPGQDKVTLFATQSNGFMQGFAYQVDIGTFRALCMNTVMGLRGKKGEGGEGAKYGRFRFVHSSKWTDAHSAAAVKTITDAKTKFSVFKEQAERLRATTFNADTTEAYVIELLMPELHKKVFNQMIEDGAVGDKRRLANMTEEEQGKRFLDAYLSKEQYHFHVDQLKGEDGNRTAIQVLRNMWNQPGIEACQDTGWAAYNGITYYTNHQRGRSEETRTDALLFGAGKDLNAKALDLSLAYCDRLEEIRRG